MRRRQRLRFPKSPKHLEQLKLSLSDHGKAIYHSLLANRQLRESRAARFGSHEHAVYGYRCTRRRQRLRFPKALKHLEQLKLSLSDHGKAIYHSLLANIQLRESRAARFGSHEHAVYGYRCTRRHQRLRFPKALKHLEQLKLSLSDHGTAIYHSLLANIQLRESRAARFGSHEHAVYGYRCTRRRQRLRFPKALKHLEQLKLSLSDHGTAIYHSLLANIQLRESRAARFGNREHAVYGYSVRDAANH
jgi:general stress protein 26